MIAMAQPFVRILGSADWHPTKHNDQSCYTLCDKILIDACPTALMTLMNNDIDPLQVNTICFTHMHADHYMGLPAILHYWRVRVASLKGLTIIGPKATVRAAVERAKNYVFYGADLIPEIAGYPNVIELEGDSVYETEDFRIAAMDSDHAVPGLCYNIMHKESGKSVGFSGDTRYLPAFGNFFKSADLLLYECSFGAGPINPVRNASCRHSSAQEAVQVCKEADVKKLLLTHTYEPNRESALAEAKAHLSIPVEWAVPFETFDI